MELSTLQVDAVLYLIGFAVSFTVYADEKDTKRMSMSLCWPLVIAFIISSLVLAFVDAIVEVIYALWKTQVAARWRAEMTKAKIRHRRK